MKKFSGYFKSEEPKTEIKEEISFQAIAGPVGPPGPAGPPGPQGPAGEDGWAGPMGPQGPKGDKGDKGERGDDGFPGWPGDKGEQGVQGERGDKGDPGQPGEPGPQGVEGPQGPMGPSGEPGPQGVEGPQGPMGPRGEPGPQGKQGIQGFPGSNGKDGKDGKDGKQGIQGERGERGVQGIQGIPGPKGEPGAQGPKGDKGDPGESGVTTVKYPLILEEGELSFDVKKIQTILSKLIKSKGDTEQLLKNNGWLRDFSTGGLVAGGGGAVGILTEGQRILKSVNDINFTGNAVTVVQKGRSVEVQINSTGGTPPESPRTITAFFVSLTDPGLEQALINGDRWYNENIGKVFTWVGAWVEF